MRLKFRKRWASLFVLLCLGFEVIASPEDLKDISDSHGRPVDIIQVPLTLADTRLQIPGVVVVSSETEIIQWVDVKSYTPAGTLLIVDQPAYYPWQLQSLRPNAENYVSVDADVDVNVRTLRRENIPGLNNGSPLVVIVELLSEMSPGQSMAIRYSRLRVPSISYDAFSLPLLISVDDGFQIIPVSRFALMPGPASSALVSTPAIVRPGEPFDAHIRVTDEAGNPISGPTPTLEVILDGVFTRRLQGGQGAELLVNNLVFSENGVHRITVRSAGGSVKGSSDVILVSDINQKILWTDLHLHGSDDVYRSGFSDAAVKNRQTGVLDLLTIIDSPESTLGGSTELIRPLERGGNVLRLYSGLQVAMADVPTDHRRLNPVSPIFAEILSGQSHYEWLGLKISNLGYKAAFVGSQTSHIPGASFGQGKTALLLSDNEPWIDALSTGNTYVVSEGKPVLLLTVNGVAPGGRVPYSERREITGEIYASFGLDKIELLRNGVVIDEIKPGDISESNIVQIKLSSPNYPKDWDLPRNGREWIGYLRAPGGQFRDITSPKIGVMHDIAINPADPSRVDFITWTHGGSRSFLVEISLKDDEVPLELSIMKGFEDIAYVPQYRPPSSTPAIRQLFTFDDLRSGGWSRSFETYGYNDVVEISMLDRKLPKSYEFRFVDATDVSVGDYYYVRIVGQEDEMIWSSPVHVGGFDVSE